MLPDCHDRIQVSQLSVERNQINKLIGRNFLRGIAQKNPLTMSNTEIDPPSKMDLEGDPEGLPGELEVADAMAAAPLSARRNKPYFKKFKEPDSDEEVGDPRNLFNIQESWRTLMSLSSCQKVMVS